MACLVRAAGGGVHIQVEQRPQNKRASVYRKQGLKKSRLKEELENVIKQALTLGLFPVSELDSYFNRLTENIFD